MKPSAATDPGTETKVTPDIGAPIIASATQYHRIRRPPVKKAALSARLPARQATVKSRATYKATVRRTVKGVIGSKV